MSDKQMYKELDAQYVFGRREEWKPEEIEMVEKAIEFAKEKHKGQERRSGEPYVNHVIETGKILAKMKMDTTTIVAGILHDILEDTQTTEKELLDNFGKEVLFLVKGASKLSKLKYHGVVRHVESLRKFFIAMAEDIRVVIIKLADRLHNIRTIEYVREDKRQRIALETLEIHARIADRLGMGALKAELEDLAFPYAYPEEYKEIKSLVEKERKPSEKRLEEVKQNLELALQVFNIKPIKIEYRLKHLYSLYQKLLRYNKDISKIHDVVALRVIVESVAECYQVLMAIHSEYNPMPGRIKDYIALPKQNGYQSLHTTIFTKDGNTAEIQIRTKEMHIEAEYGVASHLHYKEYAKKKNSEGLKKKVEWTKELLEWQKKITDEKEFLNTLKTDFFENRVFVFTPKGDVIDLPEGSSAIDFAFAIHSRIGLGIQAVKINNKLEPLETVLKRGDVVEIITSKNAKPSKKWLRCIKTSHAKRQIEKFLEGKIK